MFSLWHTAKLAKTEVNLSKEKIQFKFMLSRLTEVPTFRFTHELTYSILIFILHFKIL